MIVMNGNRLSTSRMWLLAVAAILAVAVGLAAWRFAPVPWFQGATNEVSTGYATYAVDVTDDREVVGFASDVFFGRVVGKSGQIMLDEFPRILFQVEVLEVLKGSLSGTVKVIQEAGVVEDGTMFFMAGDTKLLETGKTYLLVTKGPAPERNGGVRGAFRRQWDARTRGIRRNRGTVRACREHRTDETSGDEGDTAPGPGDDSGTEGPTGNTGSGEILETQQAKDLRTRFTYAIENEIPFDFGDASDAAEEDSSPTAQPTE